MSEKRPWPHWATLAVVCPAILFISLRHPGFGPWYLTLPLYTLATLLVRAIFDRIEECGRAVVVSTTIPPSTVGFVGGMVVGLSDLGYVLVGGRYVITRIEGSRIHLRPTLAQWARNFFGIGVRY